MSITLRKNYNHYTVLVGEKGDMFFAGRWRKTYPTGEHFETEKVFYDRSKCEKYVEMMNDREIFKLISEGI